MSRPLGARGGLLHKSDAAKTPFTVTVDPKVIPFLAIFPLANGTPQIQTLERFFSSQAVTREIW